MLFSFRTGWVAFPASTQLTCCSIEVAQNVETPKLLFRNPKPLFPIQLFSVFPALSGFPRYVFPLTFLFLIVLLIMDLTELFILLWLFVDLDLVLRINVWLYYNTVCICSHLT